jgi:hypothetical protein
MGPSIHIIQYRICDQIATFETCERYNNDPNWECHVSLDPTQHEYKLLSVLYTSIRVPSMSNTQQTLP